MFISLFISFFVTNIHAAEIKMYEKEIYLASHSVEKVFVHGDTVSIRSFLRPCAHYPGYPDKVYGDLYECRTNRESLYQLRKDENYLTLDDEALGDYIKKSALTFSCNDRHAPVLIRYNQRNVYLFSGPLFEIDE